MCINLSKEETLKLIYENRKRYNFENKFSFTTKYPWTCLNCSSQIFISYKQFSVIAIFCEKCRSRAYTGTSKELKLVYAQYMRVVKEKQLSLIEKYIS